MHPMFEQLAAVRLVPVIVINDAAKAVPLAKALCDGGLPCAEVTFRTPQAADAIRAIADELPHMLLGAGTVLTTAQVDKAIEAGAKYIVAPGLNPEVVKYCQSKNVPMLPGVCTPSEVEQGLALGLEALKFFPAEAAGGVNMLKSLSGPYGGVKFMPTGGITQKNLKDYLSVKSVFACGGSWMVKDELIASGDFAQITELTREALNIK
ncbi:MAG: bifunctional 4-hydroxy-2-oxoglutarate aldolase/2-dehydro-3-deoxy-phosphogluconate aldolase [Firmicutes bacterium]|nr:bifunctional 4-hydroxy-2-oxoglutarate aldolase/2-dehydro-3-deoxy-phosphogluconate aldolase [Bacillota bacterium]